MDLLKALDYAWELIWGIDSPSSLAISVTYAEAKAPESLDGEAGDFDMGQV